MTLPSIVPTGFAGDRTDFNKVKRDTFGAVRQESGSVVVPNGTVAGTFVGLVPFNAGARFVVSDKSFHITDIDAGTDSTVNVGIIYDDNVTYTNDVDAFASLSTAGQAGGFITIDETAWMTLVTQGNGWLVLENEANTTEAEGTVTYTVGVTYDRK